MARRGNRRQRRLKGGASSATRAIAAAANDQVIVDQLVSTAAQAQGDYAPVTVQVTAGEFDNATKGTMRVVRNRGGTTVERWLNAGSLTADQADGIALYARAHRTWLGEQRVVACYGGSGSVRGASDEEMEAAVGRRLDARRLLERLDLHVFRGMPAHYVETWKNVVLFDEPAGVAGGRLGGTTRAASETARAIIAFIGDLITTEMRRRRAA